MYTLIVDLGVLIVLIIRVLGPLIVFKKPLLGAILGEYFFDQYDVVIWDLTNSVALANYTQYDKILDMYFLVILAISVYRQWPKGFARSTGIFFFWYRLLGFVLYELTAKRILFFIFPSFLVLYFIGYHLSKKLKKREWFVKPSNFIYVLLILITLKMPQEYVLHYKEIPTWTIIKGFLGI